MYELKKQECSWCVYVWKADKWLWWLWIQSEYLTRGWALPARHYHTHTHSHTYTHTHTSPHTHTLFYAESKCVAVFISWTIKYRLSDQNNMNICSVAHWSTFDLDLSCQALWRRLRSMLTRTLVLRSSSLVFTSVFNRLAMSGTVVVELWTQFHQNVF